jgi:two-component sensor histidine kinase
MTEMAFTPTISEQALLQELNHRISNEFQSALSLVSVTAARSRSGRSTRPGREWSHPRRRDEVAHLRLLLDAPDNAQ